MGLNTLSSCLMDNHFRDCGPRSEELGQSCLFPGYFPVYCPVYFAHQVRLTLATCDLYLYELGTLIK